jgi:putative tricarboxylic transport membrane protein
MDESYRQAVLATRNNFPAFLLDLVTNPLSLVLTLAVMFMLINQTRLWRWFLKFFKRKNARAR